MLLRPAPLSLSPSNRRWRRDRTLGGKVPPSSPPATSSAGLHRQGSERQPPPRLQRLPPTSLQPLPACHRDTGSQQRQLDRNRRSKSRRRVELQHIFSQSFGHFIERPGDGRMIRKGVQHPRNLRPLPRKQKRHAHSNLDPLPQRKQVPPYAKARSRSHVKWRDTCHPKFFY